MWPTMDHTAAVRAKARRAECHAAGSAHLRTNQRCRRGGKNASTWSSRCAIRLPCGARGSSSGSIPRLWVQTGHPLALRRARVQLRINSSDLG